MEGAAAAAVADSEPGLPPHPVRRYPFPMTDYTTPPADPAAIDPALAAFLDLFNRQEYWASHEALEAAWRETGSEFYHALILYASAFVHVDRGNRHGIAAQLGKAQPLLEARRPHYLGLPVEAMLDHAAVCRSIVAENPDAPTEAWSVLIPAPRLAFDPALVRGDEPELEPEARPADD